MIRAHSRPRVRITLLSRLHGRDVVHRDTDLEHAGASRPTVVRPNLSGRENAAGRPTPSLRTVQHSRPGSRYKYAAEVKEVEQRTRNAVFQ
ncbi:hypothetical protein VTO73DRAFT_9793 [Trametes versicolor]